MIKNNKIQTILKTSIVILLILLLFATAFIVPLTQEIEGKSEENISNINTNEENIIEKELKEKPITNNEYNELLDEHIKLKYNKITNNTETNISDNTNNTENTEKIEEISNIENTNKKTSSITNQTETPNVLYATESLNFDTSGWAELTVKITAYCPCAKCNGSYVGQPTASGTPLVVGRTIAVDPRVIPLGSYVVIDGHTYVAEDTGSGIKGNRIDLLFATHEEANEWGVRTKTVLVSQTRANLNEYINDLKNPTTVDETTPNITENLTETTESITNIEDSNTENIETTESTNITENNEPTENTKIIETTENTETNNL